MSIQSLIVAANGAVPAGSLKPRNCHEAVFGWLLQSKDNKYCEIGEGGVEEAWTVLRALSEAHATEDNNRQLTGAWVAKHLYYGPNVLQIKRNTAGVMLNEGDVVFMGARNAPHHSMVIVKRQGAQRLARGFNNAGAFGGPYMGWDPALRDLADPARWTRTGDDFMGNNGGGPLWRLTYADMMHNIPDSLAF
jgi:hypothetical protein